jgi:integral membrane protein
MARSYRAYRYMSFITGTTLLLLSALLILRFADHHLYVQLHAVDKIVGVAHGVILYPIYLVCCFTLMLHARLRIVVLAAMLLAGFVPGLAFYMESLVTRQLKPQLSEVNS